MKIAVYFNHQDAIGSLYEPGYFCLYERAEAVGQQNWLPVRQVAFRVDADMGLLAVKSAIHAAVDRLDACRVLISSEVSGMIYSVLQEELDFHTWKSSGSLIEQLDSVLQKEQEQAAQKRYELVAQAGQRMPVPMLKGSPLDGCFWIDLKAALGHESGATSRQILIPFLQRGQFHQLEILCDHLPKWLSWELEQLDLSAESEVLDVSGTLQVTVYSRNTPEGRSRKPGLLGTGPALLLACPRESGNSRALPSPRPQTDEASPCTDRSSLNESCRHQ